MSVCKLKKKCEKIYCLATQIWITSAEQPDPLWTSGQHSENYNAETSTGSTTLQGWLQWQEKVGENHSKKVWETERAVTCCNYTLWHTVTHHWPTFLLRGLGQAGCSGTQPRISRPWMSNFSNWESWKDSKCFSAWTQNTYHNNTRTQTSTSVTFSRLIQSSSHGVHGMCQQGASYMSRCS